MSIFNGEKYLKEQIESILAQKDVSLKLIIRDDGSVDNTREILNAYEKKCNNVQVIYSNNVGWRKSFSELLKMAPEDDYYAFADQDDYWFSDKLVTAINRISDFSNIPCIYRGRSIIADSNLVSTGTLYQDIPVISIKRSLFQNFCQGCTLVFNNQLRKLYLLHPIEVASHDVWLPIIALHTGKLIDDNQAYMLYRVHNSNASAGKSRVQTIIKHIKVIRKKSDSVYHFNYGEVLFKDYRPFLNQSSYQICKKMTEYRTSLKAKIALLLDPEVRGNSRKRTFLVKYFVLTNSYRSDI